MTPKISIIIPIYNTQQYLKRCLDSVLKQTLDNIEIICVDDCSTDSSLEIVKEYSNHCKNLKILQLEKNSGASSARNAGIALAHGEYLAFLDSDDEVDLNFYEKLYEKAKEGNYDIVRGRAVEIAYDGKRSFVKQVQNGSKFFCLNYWIVAIYKRSLITENNIFFSTKHPLGEDLLFLHQSLIAAQSLEFVDEVYYYYFRRENGADSKILTEEKIKSALEVYEIILDNINSNFLENNLIYNFLFHHFIISCFYLSIRTTDNNLKKICAKNMVNFFAKCRNKDMLESFFAKNFPQFFVILKNNDIERLEAIFLSCKSMLDIIALELRAKLKK